MRSFYFKNFILVAAIVMLSFIILGASFVMAGRNYAMRERQETLESNVMELSRLASAYAREGALDGWNFRIILSALAQSTGNHCFLTTTQGRIVSCSDSDLPCSHIGAELPTDVLRELETAHFFSRLTQLGGIYTEYNYVAALPVLSARGEVLAYVFAATNMSGAVQVWRSLLNIFLGIAFFIMVLALVLGFISSKLRAKPINEMARAVDKFSHGDFSVRVSADDRDDELGMLSVSFNQMADALQKADQRRSEFVTNVAHELKTPMTTIAGFADGILDGTIPPEGQRSYLETISAETKRLNRLVRSMLDLSRMQSLGQEELYSRSFDATELLAETLLLLESKINDKQLDVDAQLPEFPMLVRGDKDAITQVMYNLLENAVKFSKQGSTLGLSLFKQGSKAYVSVKNRGETIPPEELPLIFDRFHKTDKSRSLDREGYGLGLYIVKTILNDHGEDIVASSRDGVTEFVFSLSLKQK